VLTIAGVAAASCCCCIDHRGVAAETAVSSDWDEQHAAAVDIEMNDRMTVVEDWPDQLTVHSEAQNCRMPEDRGRMAERPPLSADVVQLVADTGLVWPGDTAPRRPPDCCCRRRWSGGRGRRLIGWRRMERAGRD
jgi:hypothetical protein